MYKAIIFDLDNTLLNYNFSENAALRRTLNEHDLFVHDEAGWDAFWDSYSQHNFRYWIDFVNHLGPHKSIEEVLRSSFRETLQMHDALHTSLAETYWHYFCNSCDFEEGADSLLDTLQSDFSYKLGIISNGIGFAQRKRLDTGNISDRFHSIVVSDEAGVRKPRKEIFDISLHELQLDRNEVMFIGDSLTDDYYGSINAGIDFCFYNRGNVAIPNDIKPKYTISGIADLLQII
ncbi:HAD family hydrolase [Paenibacillus sp. NEAU-GSW1]|uniref:HAD family hydrolase n=1 Tax=Paenibacillus sp. NEAU-GSW1 TaxID=2682486 RepID=UPI0012E2679A|nr:HAD-IA family hydrolase [Paenibacillus sp. NEAU-GSW1]MUT65192.1 HAD-IA family hydrolase [Paenibacillus sp. NEAU-GSW1]